MRIFVYLKCEYPLFMKKLFTLIAVLFSLSVQAQYYLGFDGADTFFNRFIVVDTINYHHNQWQIGSPHKATFTSAFSAPNVFITDTLNPYAPNDTSVFILKMAKSIPAWPGSTHYGPLYNISFDYQLDIDTQSIARLEISEDSGGHWHDINDSLISTYSWATSTIDTIATTSGSWRNFNVYRNFGPSASDTALFRFTFISGTSTTPHDGWMIDNMFIYYWFEGGVAQTQNDNLISLYPNPSKGNIYIHANQSASNASVIVYDLSGREVHSRFITTSDTYINLSLPSGMYILKYVVGDEYCTKKILIER